ncbi:DUF1549 domain-containing protein [Schlesneria sp. DSM 10557]|uniref:DUF1549 domain-containing protein n=2 Tax=unclassified Schlesneria TaxID=2762017 RepID=UPI00359FFB06
MNVVCKRQLQWLMAVILISSIFVAPSGLFAQSPDRIDFGRQIQPILAKRCFACHGPDTAEADLRLNDKHAVFKKLPSGAQPIVAGQPDESEILRRITATDDSLRMPPEGPPLTVEQIELLTAWIAQGADWKEHWAFLPLQSTPPPEVKNSEWVKNPIDAFILHKLEQAGLKPAPEAEKFAMIRRLTYDLTGLPPTGEEIQSFISDKSANAYEKLVDRLLASERYGEHWARHWLDVVRYADTNSFERDGPKPNAWRYRDYVIRAFNSDKPYDQFVREQLAGDELPDAGSDGLIATGFYRLGQWDDEPADRLLAVFDGFDDIITTTAQGFLGLTVNCARCHDHKIDPIPQQDYYSFLSFFQGITPNGYPNPNVERPIFRDEAAKQDYLAAVKEHQAQLDQIQASITKIEQEFRGKLNSQTTGQQSPDLDDLEYRFYRDTWDKLPDFDLLKPETTGKLEQGFFDITPASREFSFGFVFKGILKVPADGEYTFTLDSDDGSRLSIQGQEVLLHDGIHGTGNPQKRTIELKKGRTPVRLDYFQGPTGAKELIVKWSGPGFTNRYLSAISNDASLGESAPTKQRDFKSLITSQGPTLLGEKRYLEYTELLKQLEQKKNQKVNVDMALCVTEVGPTPPETMLLKRGNPQSPGDKVVPAYLSALGGGDARIPEPPAGATSSGRRLALANWITAPDNRLAARVMVNRIWQHLFGRGIVRSPNNFGLLGDPPTHPELLDWLAIEFTRGADADGAGATRKIPGAPWSIKRLQKLIVLSNTYRMSSRAPHRSAETSSQESATNGPNPLEVDPLNNLFWRHDMRRLGAEEIRDTILAVSGKLNLKMYGPGVFPKISDEVKAGQSVPGAGWNESSEEDQSRRSVYVQVKRSLILPILSDFDVADTDNSCAARFTTTQPTQALGMLNGEFLNQQAVVFAARLKDEKGTELKQQVIQAYRIALNREPDPVMVDRGIQLIHDLKTKHGLSADKALEQFCLMTLNLNESIYLD